MCEIYITAVNRREAFMSGFVKTDSLSIKNLEFLTQYTNPDTRQIESKNAKGKL
jgi:hypothetical protein